MTDLKDTTLQQLHDAIVSKKNLVKLEYDLVNGTWLLKYSDREQEDVIHPEELIEFLSK